MSAPQSDYRLLCFPCQQAAKHFSASVSDKFSKHNDITNNRVLFVLNVRFELITMQEKRAQLPEEPSKHPK